MTAITFQRNNFNWDREFNSTQGMVARDLKKRAEKLRVYAVRQVGKQTGGLARSIKVSMTPGPTGPQAWVGSDHRIALMHHDGTRPHEIDAVPGHLLRFAVRGRIVYAHKVHNRGTRPNRYLTDNLRRVVVD